MVLRCGGCGVERLWPPAHRQDDSTEAYRWRMVEEARWRWFAEDTYRFLVACVGEAPRSFLDVGCSTGATVGYFAERGWTARGVDRDRRAVEYGRSLGRHLTCGTLESLDEQFDVVLLSHVFEHLLDPVLFLDAARPRLSPQGYLALVTPTYRSLPGWWYGTRWNGWDPGEHEWIYSRHTIQRLLSRTGFVPVTIRQRVHRGWPEPRWWSKAFWWKRAPLIAAMRLAGLAGMADGLYVLARQR
ncbi:MAG: class I SAM-dependent methyltransferase [Candidatus Rokubacteria bacterium]|nr:class I SAM-dependent methyltransferase [Candidatus Rokubacteria bacterium]